MFNTINKFLSALSFLTIFPSPAAARNPENLKRASHLFPLAGLVIGLVLSLTYFLFRQVFPQFLTATIVVLAEIVITRGLHADGFADFFDGFFGGKTKEEKLLIMQDSRVGVFGVLSLLFLALLKIGLINLFSSPHIYAALLVTPVFSRWLVLYPILRIPYAKEVGLGKIFELKMGNYLYATTFSVLVIAIAASFQGIISLIFLFFLFQYLFRYIVKRLGGMTGDIYGFLIEFGELLMLAVLFLTNRFLNF